MKKFIGVICFSVLLTACGSSDKQSKKRETREKAVKIEKISKSEIMKSNVSSGIVEPLNEIKRITDTGGTVKKINFKNGDRVKKGEIVVVLEDKEIESNYLKAEANYKAAQVDYNIKKINFDKFKNLYEKQLVSENEYLNIKNTLVQSEGGYKTAKAAYIKSKNDFDNLIFAAKEDGVVTDLELKVYEKVAPNSKIYTLVDDRKMIVKTYISANEIEGTQIGSHARIKIDGLSQELSGKVYEINPVANTDSKKYQAKVEIDNTAKKLKKGMYANVLVETGNKTGFLVPKTAIIIKDLYSYIFVIENGIAKRVRVERGYSQNDFQEIINENLISGFDIVIDGQYILEDKDKVKVLNQEV